MDTSSFVQMMEHLKCRKTMTSESLADTDLLNSASR